jgi:hypothetical protein
LRRASLIALVLIFLYVGIVAYSAIQVVKAAPRVGATSYAFESNATVGITTSFSLSNPTYLEIQQFSLHFQIQNGTGTELIASTAGPTDIAPSASVVLPIALYLPLTAAGASLLTENQYLQWDVWGNATYGYLFTASIDVETQKSWGAPFANLTLTVGAPGMTNGSTAIPVTLAFSNDASFADTGSLDFQVVPASGPNCAQGSFVLNVSPNSPYDATRNVPIAAGCDPHGGHVSAQFVGSGFTVPLPSEAIP